MPFQALTDYRNYNHVPVAGAVWFHPGNGNAYCCACEKDQGGRQDLSVYRMRAGTSTWELVKRYEGTTDSAAQVTMGGAAIGPGGHMIVVTSLIIPGAPKVTTEGFQGVWIRENNIDQPWSVAAGASADTAAIEALQRQVAQQATAIAGIELALGNIGQEGGALTPEQNKVLEYLVRAIGPLLSAT